MTNGYTRYIVVTTQFDGLHNWPEGHPTYLQSPHRHTFTVRAEIEVAHNDRELEIITVKSVIDSFVRGCWPSSRDFNLFILESTSCEEVATRIVKYLAVRYQLPTVEPIVIQHFGVKEYHANRSIVVEVLEDGMLGAKVSGY